MPSKRRRTFSPFLGPSLQIGQQTADQDPAMDAGVARELVAGLAELAGHAPRIVALMMVESRCDLDQGLKEASVGVADLVPQVLPHLVRLEEFLAVKVTDPGLEPLTPIEKSIHD